MNGSKFFVYNILLLILLLNNFASKAQPASIDSLLVKTFKTDAVLPVLINAAIKFSPQVQINSSTVRYASENVQIAKKAIFNAVSLLSNYNYGNNISALNYQSLTSGGYNFTTAQTAFYNVGIGLQLPLGQIISRKNYISAGKALVSAAMAEKEKSALIIKEEVIRLYQDFKLNHKLMEISAKSKQAFQVNNTMAEKDFLNGEITVDQVSKVLENYTLSIITFETYVNKFQTSYMMLEAFTGTNLSKLIMSVK